MDPEPEDTGVAETPTSPHEFGRAEMFAEVKRNLLKVVKEEIRQEAFGFSEIPHKQQVRTYLKEVRELVSKCSQMDGGTKLASIETAMSAALDILGVALREGQTLAEEIKAMRAKRASFSAEAAKEYATKETEREIEKLRRQVKKEETRAKELADKCETYAGEVREQRSEVSLLTQKLQDFKERAKERVERVDEELRTAETRHSRELEKLRRKMRQEKQEEIANMMEKVTDDLKREHNAARQRSSASSDAFWKTRFESLESEHRAEVGRSAALQNDLAACRKEVALLTAREREARDAFVNATTEGERAATAAAVASVASKTEIQDLRKQIKDLEKKLAKEKKRSTKAKNELGTAEDKLSTAREDALREFRKEKRALEAKADSAAEQSMSLKVAVDGLKTQLKKSIDELAGEKEKHKNSKAKFTKAFSESKATQENLREQIEKLTNARAKDGDTTASLSAEIIQLKGSVKELKGKLMLAEEAVAATEADLQAEKNRTTVVRNELNELQFAQLQQEATGGRKLYEATRRVRALEGEVQNLKAASQHDDGARLVSEALEPPPMGDTDGSDEDSGPPQIRMVGFIENDESDDDHLGPGISTDVASSGPPSTDVPQSTDSLSDDNQTVTEQDTPTKPAKLIDSQLVEDTKAFDDGPPPIPDSVDSDDNEGPALAVQSVKVVQHSSDDEGPPPIDDGSDSESDCQPPTTSKKTVETQEEDDFNEDELTEFEKVIDKSMAKMATVLGDGNGATPSGKAPRINSAADIDEYLDTLLGSVKGSSGPNAAASSASGLAAKPTVARGVKVKPPLPSSPKPVLKASQRQKGSPKLPVSQKAQISMKPKAVPEQKPPPAAKAKPAIDKYSTLFDDSDEDDTFKPKTNSKPKPPAKSAKASSLFDDDSEDD